MAINCVGRKFENNLQTAIKESLALFPVDELKAEQRLIIEKIVARRDVLGQWPTSYARSLTVAWHILKFLEGCWALSSRPILWLFRH